MATRSPLADPSDAEILRRVKEKVAAAQWSFEYGVTETLTAWRKQDEAQEEDVDLVIDLHLSHLIRDCNTAMSTVETSDPPGWELVVQGTHFGGRTLSVTVFLHKDDTESVKVRSIGR